MIRAKRLQDALLSIFDKRSKMMAITLGMTMTNKINVGLTTGHITTLEQFLEVCHIYLTTGKVKSLFSDEELTEILDDAEAKKYTKTFIEELVNNLIKYNRVLNTTNGVSVAAETYDRSIKFHAFLSESEERALFTTARLLSEIEGMSDDFKKTELYQFAHKNLCDALNNIDIDIPLPEMLDEETARIRNLSCLMQDMLGDLEILDFLEANDTLVHVLRQQIEEIFTRDFPNGIDAEYAYPTADEIAEILKEKDLGLDY